MDAEVMVLLSLLGAVVPAGALAQTSAVPVPAPQPVESTPLAGVLMLGSTALPPAEVQPFVRPLLGRPVDAGLLRAIRAAVSAAHDAAGLGLVSVDAPVVRGGIALVRVQPITLGSVSVEGAGREVPSGPLHNRVSAALPALRLGETPNLRRLDRQLRLANLQPHRRVSVDFRAIDAAAPSVPPPPPGEARAPLGPTAFGAQPGQPVAAANDAPKAVAPIRLPGFSAKMSGASPVEARILATGASPFYGRVLVDNAGQPSTGRERLRVQLGHGDLFGPGHALDVTGLVSIPYPGRQHQIAVRTQHPLPQAGTLITAEASISRSRPGLINDFFDVSGNSKIAGVSARHLLPRWGGLEPSIEAGFEFAVHNDIVTFFGTNLGSRVGTSPLALTFAGTWQTGRWSGFAQVRARHNLGIGSDADRARYEAARAAASPRWSTIDAFAQLRRAIGARQEAVFRVQGQWTRSALIGPQQFRAGGQSSMRGLIESELAADSGVTATAEYWWTLGGGHRVAALADGVTARRNRALPGEPRQIGAASAGVAWQWAFARGVQLNLAAARILAADDLPRSHAGDDRLHLLLEWAL